MVCEKVLGKLSTFNVNGKTVDYVDIDWDDAFKKIHRKSPRRDATSAFVWTTQCLHTD